MHETSTLSTGGLRNIARNQVDDIGHPCAFNCGESSDGGGSRPSLIERSFDVTLRSLFVGLASSEHEKEERSRRCVADRSINIAPANKRMILRFESSPRRSAVSRGPH